MAAQQDNVACPVCHQQLFGSNAVVNNHLDSCLRSAPTTDLIIDEINAQLRYLFNVLFPWGCSEAASALTSDATQLLTRVLKRVETTPLLPQIWHTTYSLRLLLGLAVISIQSDHKPAALGFLDGALSLIGQHEELKDQLSVCYTLRAVLLEETDQIPQAVSDYQSALSLFRDRVPSLTLTNPLQDGDKIFTNIRSIPYPESIVFCGSYHRFVLNALMRLTRTQSPSAYFHFLEQSVALDFHRLGQRCILKNEYEEAISYFNSCITLSKDSLAQVDWKYSIDALERIRFCYISMPRTCRRQLQPTMTRLLCYEEADPLFIGDKFASLSAQMLQRSKSIEEVASKALWVGLHLACTSQWKDAIHRLRDCSDFYLRIDKKASPRYAQVLTNLAELYEQINDLFLAWDCYAHALKTLLLILPADHPDVALLLLKISWLLLKISDRSGR